MDERKEVFLLKVIVAVGLVTVYIAIAKININTLAQLYKPIGGYTRETSVFPNPNVYGLYLFVILCFQMIIYDILVAKWRKYLFIIFVISPTVLMIMLTFSRRAIGMLVLSTLLFFLLKKGAKIKFAALTVLFTLPFVYLIDFDSVINRMVSIYDFNYESNAVRIQLNIQAWQIIARDLVSFLLGSGYGQYGQSSIFLDVHDITRPHNYYLQIILEMGFVGLIIYLAIIASVFRLAVKSLKNYLPTALFNKVLIYALAFMALCISAIVGSTPVTFPLNLLQWLIAGLIITNYQYIRRYYVRRI